MREAASKPWKRARPFTLVVALCALLLALCGFALGGLLGSRGRQPLAASPKKGGHLFGLAAEERPGPPKPAFSPVGAYRVKALSLRLVEPPGAGLPERILPTVVWIPVAPRRRALASSAHLPPYPLVVFSQGYDIAVQAYSRLLESWASAGLVVAAPAYPGTSPSPASLLDEADIINHPRDLRFVIASIVSMAHQSRSRLSGLVETSEIGVAGHSDGGDVTIAVGDSSCCRDNLVKAVVVLSGAELTSFGGTYFKGPSPPLLVVQGDADTINPPACSREIYDSARGAKFYLELLGAGHVSPYVGPKTGAAKDLGIVIKVTTGFFEAELGHQRGAVAAMRSAASVPGVAVLRTGGSAPAEPGYCPGAPT